MIWAHAQTLDNTINNGESPQVLPDSNHKTVMIWRVGRTANAPGPAASVTDYESHHHACKWTAENPPRNADDVTGAVGSKVPEIRLD